jgi:hypothetical protein
MKKNLFRIFLGLIFFCANPNFSSAEIIDIRNEEKTFGDWKVFCETDEMMGISHCKIAAKFYDNASAFTIQPLTRSTTQIFVIIPQVQIGSFVKLRIDQADLILSKNTSERDFGMIPLDDEQKNFIYSQMKSGEFLFLRFSVRNSEKEITAKLNLRDFRNALNYLNNRNKTSK